MAAFVFLVALAASALPPWSWDRMHTWCFPGCDPSDGTCSPPRYSAAEAAHYARFDLVLFQGQNYTQRGNGSWNPTEEAESVLAAKTIRKAGGAAKPTFPYIQFSMPQSWYEHQARFNDPTTANKRMWAVDSDGVYLDALTDSGAAGLDEGGNYPYPWRRLYDWRSPEARNFFLNSTIGWILDSPELSGYGNFNSCFGPSFVYFQPNATQHAPCIMLYLVAVLVGY